MLGSLQSNLTEHVVLNELFIRPAVRSSDAPVFFFILTTFYTVDAHWRHQIQARGRKTVALGFTEITFEQLCSSCVCHQI